MLWRLRFPATVQQNLVSTTNPKGSVTNSDLEFAATIIQHDVVCHNYDVREKTLHTGTNNQATQAWHQKGSTTTARSLHSFYVSRPSASGSTATSRSTATCPASSMPWLMMHQGYGT
jgi:hypothetical protein